MNRKNIRRLATIDVGTNTALMLISEWQGALRVLHDETQFVRLGQGVDASGWISAVSLGRLCDTLLYYRAVAASWHVDHILVGGTSASRDARNQAALIEIVSRTTGLSCGPSTTP